MAMGLKNIKEKIVDYTRPIRDFIGGTITKPVKRLVPLTLVGLSLAYANPAARADYLSFHMGTRYLSDTFSTLETEQTALNQERTHKTGISQSLLGLDGHLHFKHRNTEVDFIGWHAIEQDNDGIAGVSLQQNNYTIQALVESSIDDVPSSAISDLYALVFNGSLFIDRRVTEQVNFQTQQAKAGVAMRWYSFWPVTSDRTTQAQFGIASVFDEISMPSQVATELDIQFKLPHPGRLSFHVAYLFSVRDIPINQTRRKISSTVNYLFLKRNFSFELALSRHLMAQQRQQTDRRDVKAYYDEKSLQARIGILF